MILFLITFHRVFLGDFKFFLPHLAANCLLLQVEFKEGNFKPPEIKSNIELPENVDVFGQKISLSPVQQSLSPLENAVAGIARTISGQPPLKIQIPGERTKSWLLTTYLDKDLRISKGDGGIFVLVKEGSSLLY